MNNQGIDIMCNGCGMCVEVCPAECIQLAFVNGYIHSIYIKVDECLCCCSCSNWCPYSDLEFFINQNICVGVGGGHGDDNNENSENNENDDDNNSGNGNSDRMIGLQGLNHMIYRLTTENVTINQVKYREGYPVLDAVNVGLNTNGIITSCLNFLKQANLDKYALGFGKAMGIAGFAIGSTQTMIALFDGEISSADILSTISTALAAVSLIGVFFPPAIVISGIAGVTGCIIGLVATGISSRSNPLILNENNEKKIYLYIE